MAAQTSAERVAAHRERSKTEGKENADREAYVAREVAVSASQGCDLERTEHYARWRWDCVQDGTVAAL
jgi:hypothetical protein